MKLLINTLALAMVVVMPAHAKVATVVPALSWDQAMANQVAKITRDESLPKLKKRDGTLFGPETDKEKAVPLLPEVFTKQVVDHAVFWTVVLWCELNTHKMPFDELTDSTRWNERQLGFIMLLHGYVAAMMKDQLQRSGTCPDNFRSYLMKTYPMVIPTKAEPAGKM